MIDYLNIIWLSPLAQTSESSQSFVGILFYLLISLSIASLSSLWEAVMLSSSGAYVESLYQTGTLSGRVMKRLKDNIDAPISAILTLNTFVNTIGAAGVGVEVTSVLGSQWFGLVSFILTVLILVFSEIIPKFIGAVYWRPLLPFTAYSVQLLVWILSPVVWTFQKLTQLLAPTEESRHIITKSELATMAQLSTSGGSLPEEEHTILKNLLHLEQVQISNIMTPRTVMFASQQDTTIHQVLETHREIPYARIPIYGENTDDVVGFVLRTDLLIEAARNNRQKRLVELKRDIQSFPETIAVSKLLSEFIRRKLHIALVIDEYGGTAGIITMEDMIESLIGAEITDESDVVTDLRELAQQRFQRQSLLLDLVGNPTKEVKSPSDT